MKLELFTKSLTDKFIFIQTKKFAIYNFIIKINRIDKFKNKYRIDSIRLKYHDYGSDGFYFVTICVNHGSVPFGNVKNGVMYLNEFGLAVQGFWIDIMYHFPFVHLDEFVIMPDHVHGLIYINKMHVKITNNVRQDAEAHSVEAHSVVEAQDLAPLHVGSTHIAQPNVAPLRQFNQFGPQSKNLASIIRGFKIGVTKYAKDQKLHFKWQGRYYESIVKGEDHLFRVRNYIKNNPLKVKSN